MHSGTKARHHFPTCVYTIKEAKIPLQHPCTVLEVVIIRSKYAHFGWSLHVADLFRQIRHGNRNKTAKYVSDGVYIAGEGLQHPLGLIWPLTGTPKVLRAVVRSTIVIWKAHVMLWNILEIQTKIQIQIQTPRNEFRHNLTVKIRPAYLLRPNSKIDKKKYLTTTARHSSFDWYVIYYLIRSGSVI